jgi:hypothetical protein
VIEVEGVVGVVFSLGLGVDFVVEVTEDRLGLVEVGVAVAVVEEEGVEAEVEEEVRGVEGVSFGFGVGVEEPVGVSGLVLVGVVDVLGKAFTMLPLTKIPYLASQVKYRTP